MNRLYHGDNRPINKRMEIVYFLWYRGGSTQNFWVREYFLCGLWGWALEQLKRDGWIYHCWETQHYFLCHDILKKLNRNS